MYKGVNPPLPVAKDSQMKSRANSKAINDAIERAHRMRADETRRAIAATFALPGVVFAKLATRLRQPTVRLSRAG